MFKGTVEKYGLITTSLYPPNTSPANKLLDVLKFKIQNFEDKQTKKLLVYSNIYFIASNIVQPI